jgi:hypothetical protein
MQSPIFPRNQRHSLNYYASVLSVLLAGLNARQRQAAIAGNLNSAGLPSPTGADWNESMVKSLLKRLRRRTGPVWHALLELCFDGKFSRAQAQPLLQVL